MNAGRMFLMALPILTLVALDVPQAAAQPGLSIDENSYYKLSTEFRGIEWMLDVINGGPKDNLTRLEPDQNVSGQFWKFIKNPDGTFRLTTLFRGPGMCLDIFNGGPNDNQPHLANCATVSGQSWNLIKNPDGTFRLTTLFRGPGMCLDIFNGGPNDNQPHLANCATVSGQVWILTNQFCRNYAETAVQQSVNNLKMGCHYSGNRWSTDKNGHYAWCLTVPQAAANAEEQGRTTDLQACKPHVLETLTDRCSGDVIIAGHYGDDLAAAQRDGIFLQRGGPPGPQRDSALLIQGHTWIRWFCHSTTGNWADPGTWRLNSGGVSAGCQFEETTGEVSNCEPINVDLSAAIGNPDGWTAERSRCESDNTKYIKGLLGTDRLLQIQCWGH